MDARRVTLTSLPIAFAACGLDVVGTSDLVVGSDAGADVAIVVEDSAQQGVGPESGPAALPSGIIAGGGTAVAPSGLAMQTHLIYAEHAKTWWLFSIYSASDKTLQAYSSSDFVTWSTAAPLTLPFAHANEGANFSVAYADLDGHDVVHLAIGFNIADNDKRHYHARATISDVGIAWETPALVVAIVDPASIGVEGCHTVVTASGRVVDTTGWAPYSNDPLKTGNQNAFISATVDDGTTWNGVFGAGKDVEAEPLTVNAHFGLPLSSGEVLLMWENASAEPNPSNVRWTRLGAGGATLDIDDVFTSGGQGWNDWSATRLTDTDIHAVRRRTTGKLEHRRWNGATWKNGAALPELETAANHGVVLLHDTSRVALVAIATDNTTLMGTTWSAPAWSAWTTLAGSRADRTNLTGFSSPTAGSAIAWTETAAGQTQVVGQRVTF